MLDLIPSEAEKVDCHIVVQEQLKLKKVMAERSIGGIHFNGGGKETLRSVGPLEWVVIVFPIHGCVVEVSEELLTVALQLTQSQATKR